MSPTCDGQASHAYPSASRRVRGRAATLGGRRRVAVSAAARAGKRESAARRPEAGLQQQADALATIAGAFIVCKQGLVESRGYAANQDWIDAGAIIGTVSSTCSNAEDDLSAYSSSYG